MDVLKTLMRRRRERTQSPSVTVHIHVSGPVDPAELSKRIYDMVTAQIGERYRENRRAERRDELLAAGRYDPEDLKTIFEA